MPRLTPRNHIESHRLRVPGVLSPLRAPGFLRNRAYLLRRYMAREIRPVELSVRKRRPHNEIIRTENSQALSVLPSLGVPPLFQSEEQIPWIQRSREGKAEQTCCARPLVVDRRRGRGMARDQASNTHKAIRLPCGSLQRIRNSNQSRFHVVDFHKVGLLFGRTRWHSSGAKRTRRLEPFQ